MTRYLVRLVLNASAFYLIFPRLPGIQFHGDFVTALAAGVLFALIAWIVEWLAFTVCAILTVSSLGTALYILIPAWILGFWLLPVVTLKFVCDLIPGTISISSWEPAIWGGTILLCIGLATAEINDGTKKASSPTAA